MIDVSSDAKPTYQAVITALEADLTVSAKVDVKASEGTGSKRLMNLQVKFRADQFFSKKARRRF